MKKEINIAIYGNVKKLFHTCSNAAKLIFVSSLKNRKTFSFALLSEMSTLNSLYVRICYIKCEIYKRSDGSLNDVIRCINNM